MTERLRAPIQRYGGKGNMLAKLLPLIPDGRVYVEPFFGGGAVFFAKQPSPVEVINDIEKDVVNLMRCLQSRETFEELRHRLMWTPYAREELRRSIEVLAMPDAPPVDRAWAYFVAVNQGMSGIVSSGDGNWSRTFLPDRGMAMSTNKWLMRLSMLDAWRWRLMRAQIDCRDALEVIRYWDSDETVFYLDPPYVHGTRADKRAYRHEMTDEQHRALVELILRVKGKVVVSGYDHEIYAPLTDAGWRKHEFDTACYAAGRVRSSGLQGKGAATVKAPRREIVWVKP